MDEKTVIVGKMSKKTAIIPLIIGGCLFWRFTVLYIIHKFCNYSYSISGIAVNGYWCYFLHCGL